MTTPMKSAAEVIAWSLEDRGLAPSDWSGHFADKVQEALDAAGYAIVPKEPSERMVLDGWNALMEWDARTGDDKGIADIYRAMLATAAATTPKED